MRKVLVGLTLLVSLALSIGCLAVGNPEVRNISSKDLAHAPIALAEYIKTNQIPTNWMGGVIVQQRWVHSYGIDSDSWNKVQLRVYVPNKMVFLIPCNPRQEKGFIDDYAPGDIVALAWDGTARANSPQDTAWLCKEDVLLMQKGGALIVGAGATP